MKEEHFVMRCRHCNGVIAQCRCVGIKATILGDCEKCKKTLAGKMAKGLYIGIVAPFAILAACVQMVFKALGRL